MAGWTRNRALLSDVDELIYPNTGLDELDGDSISNDLVSLKRMDFHSNLIRHVPAIEHGRLEFIDLSLNRIASVDPNIHLPQLRVLKLANNSLSRIEFVLGCPLLEELDISNNNVRSIDPVAECLNLRTLNVCNNAISRIPNLTKLAFLQELLLSGNRIQSLQMIPKILPIESLEALYLAKNEVENFFELKYLTALKRMKRLDIDGNPCLETIRDQFDVVPFLAFLCPRLEIVNDARLTSVQKDQGKNLFLDPARGTLDDRLLKFLSPGHEKNLIAYLRKMCPPEYVVAHRGASQFQQMLNVDARKDARERVARPVASVEKLPEQPKEASASSSLDPEVLKRIETLENTCAMQDQALKYLWTEVQLLRSIVDEQKSLSASQNGTSQPISLSQSQSQSQSQKPAQKDQQAPVLPAAQKKVVDPEAQRKAATTIQKLWRGYWCRLVFRVVHEDYILTKCKLSVAATRIQRCFRAHLIRRKSRRRLLLTSPM